MALVQSLAAQVLAVLRDVGYDNWTLNSINAAIYEGELSVVNFEPEATATLATHSCTQGVEQTIANDGHRLLSVIHNVSPSGSYGRGVRRKAVEDLDALTPNWRGAVTSDVIREYAIDERLPKMFFTNPPASDAAKLRISYSKTPTAYGTVGASTKTTVGDTYAPAVVEWALYRLFGHDVENSVNISRSQQHYQVFFNLLGLKVQNEKIQSPLNPEHKR